jgi:hypothetical protein
MLMKCRRAFYVCKKRSAVLGGVFTVVSIGLNLLFSKAGRTRLLFFSFCVYFILFDLISFGTGADTREGVLMLFWMLVIGLGVPVNARSRSCFCIYIASIHDFYCM